MKQWIESKLHKKEADHTYSYNWKNLFCEICKDKFHNSYYHKDNRFYLLNHLRPESGNYIILESFTNTPHKTIHVIYFEDEMVDTSMPIEFTVGRDNTVNIRITDISVSRLHSTITYVNNEFYVSDMNSKFGTLALLQSPFPIPYNPKHSVSFQIGR